MLYLIRTACEEWVVEAKWLDHAIAQVNDIVRGNYESETTQTFWFEYALNDLQPFDAEVHDCSFEYNGKKYGYDAHDWLQDYVEVNPIAPDCTESEHEWQDESDRVYQGSSGIGVSYWQVCKKCGCGKHYDSGASGPNYSGGWESIRYEANRYQLSAD